MATMVRNRRSSFGTYCAQCDNELIAPEWSEYRNKRRIRHLWHGNVISVLRPSLTHNRW
jgi:hypothetical protein